MKKLRKIRELILGKPREASLIRVVEKEMKTPQAKKIVECPDLFETETSLYKVRKVGEEIGEDAYVELEKIGILDRYSSVPAGTVGKAKGLIFTQTGIVLDGCLNDEITKTSGVTAIQKRFPYSEENLKTALGDLYTITKEKEDVVLRGSAENSGRRLFETGTSLYSMQNETKNGAIELKKIAVLRGSSGVSAGEVFKGDKLVIESHPGEYMLDNAVVLSKDGKYVMNTSSIVAVYEYIQPTKENLEKMLGEIGLFDKKGLAFYNIK